MEFHNYIFKYCEKKLVLQRKYPTLCIISLYIKHLIQEKKTTINLYLLFSEVFQHIGLMHEQYQFCPWCYEDMSLVLPSLFRQIKRQDTVDIHIEYSQGEIIFLLSWKYCFLCYYCQWCYHKDCVTPQTFSIKIGQTFLFLNLAYVVITSGSAANKVDK
jgi:hypothetical protein